MTTFTCFALVVHWLNKVFNGCVVGVHAKFGPGFVLIHPIGVVVNSAVRGGRNVWIESGVVIGDNRGGVPALEAELDDGTGVLTVIWLGRRRISGIAPGRSLQVEGRIGRQEGEPVLFNPRYELMP